MQTKGQLMKSLNTAFSFAPPSILSLTICNQCDFKHCKWCFYYSQKITGEYGVPASMQCKITQTERKATDYLCKKMKENGLEKYCENYVEMGNFDDPILKRDAFTLSLLNFSYDV